MKGFCLFNFQTGKHIKGDFYNNNLVISSPPKDPLAYQVNAQNYFEIGFLIKNHKKGSLNIFK